MTSRRYWNATLLSVSDRLAVFECLGDEIQVTRPVVADYLRESVEAMWRGWVGQIGVLTLRSETNSENAGRIDAGFSPYPDQALRKVAEAADSWLWRAGEGKPFSIKAGVVPGLMGRFIAEDPEFLELPIPAEFRALCGRFEVSPREVLLQLIANVCELENHAVNPREDQLQAGNSNERNAALAYFLMAHSQY